MRRRSRHDIADTLNGMKTGQAFQMSEEEYEDLFTPHLGDLQLGFHTPKEVLFDMLLGSRFGTFEIENRLDSAHIIIHRISIDGQADDDS